MMWQQLDVDEWEQVARDVATRIDSDTLRLWLGGSGMPCPVCGEYAREGDDCQWGHYDAIGEIVDEYVLNRRM